MEGGDLRLCSVCDFCASEIILIAMLVASIALAVDHPGGGGCMAGAAELRAGPNASSRRLENGAPHTERWPIATWSRFFFTHLRTLQTFA
jgi:hypothetical protein